MYYYKDENNNYFIADYKMSWLTQLTKEEWEEGNFRKNIEKYSQEQQAILIKQRRIAELKQNLANTDYQAIKYAEGQLSVEEYMPIRTLRQSWRDEINILESQL